MYKTPLEVSTLYSLSSSSASSTLAAIGLLVTTPAGTASEPVVAGTESPTASSAISVIRGPFSFAVVLTFLSARLAFFFALISLGSYE